jgi:RNA polymerase sigma factor (sigma-70 family)
MLDGTGEGPPGLADRILAGDRKAEAELVEFFGPRVFAILCARTQDREASRDLLHDALIGILRAVRKGELRDAGKLPAFIASVARNLAHTHLRGRIRARLSQPIEEDDFVSPGHADAFEAAERVALVQQALLQLDATDREILTRILAEGHKLTAIARSLGMSQEAVRQRKSRALKKMAEIVKGL